MSLVTTPLRLDSVSLIPIRLRFCECNSSKSEVLTVAEGGDDRVENGGQGVDALYRVDVGRLGLARDTLQLHHVQILPDRHHDDVCSYNVRYLGLTWV